MTFSIKGTLVTAALSGAVLAGGAHAEQLRLSLGLPETHAFYQPMEKFGAALADAGIEAQLYSLQVLSVVEATSGVRDGLVDAAMVLFPYFANEFSEANLAAELSMLATSGTHAAMPGAAMNGATMEYIFQECPACLQQFKDQNQVYVSGTSTTDYALVCNTPVASLADMAGKRLRAGAGNYTRMAEFVGATAVTMGGAEVFDALDKGVVECTMQPVASILDFRYIEVTNSVLTGFPGGVFSGVGLTNFNRDKWQGLTTEQRAAALKAGAMAAAAGYFNNVAMDETSAAAAREGGMNIFEADAELLAKVAEFVESDMPVVKGDLTDKYGLQDVDAKIETVRGLIEKWKGLTNAPDMTEEALAQLYWDEILSKVDPATYGMD